MRPIRWAAAPAKAFWAALYGGKPDPALNLPLRFITQRVELDSECAQLAQADARVFPVERRPESGDQANMTYWAGAC